MFNLPLVRGCNKEEFYQNVLAALFQEQPNYKVELEHVVNITPTDLRKNRKALMQYGVTVNSINHYTCNGVQVELGGTRYDLYLKYKQDKYFIVEVKSNFDRIKKCRDEDEEDKNQLIRYFVSHVLRYGTAPDIINLIYISNVDADKEVRMKNIMTKVLDQVTKFCKDAPTKISGSVVMIEKNLSEVTMQAIKDGTFYTNGKTGA